MATIHLLRFEILIMTPQEFVWLEMERLVRFRNHSGNRMFFPEEALGKYFLANVSQCVQRAPNKYSYSEPVNNNLNVPAADDGSWAVPIFNGLYVMAQQLALPGAENSSAPDSVRPSAELRTTFNEHPKNPAFLRRGFSGFSMLTARIFGGTLTVNTIRIGFVSG